MNYYPTKVIHSIGQLIVMTRSNNVCGTMSQRVGTKSFLEPPNLVKLTPWPGSMTRLEKLKFSESETSQAAAVMVSSKVSLQQNLRIRRRII